MFCYYATFVFLLAFPALHAAGHGEHFTVHESRVIYIERNATLDWYEASSKCRQMNMKLATIRSKNELDDIVKYQEHDARYWLSLNDLENEGQFVSGFSSQPAPFLNWRQGQPDNYNSDQHCVFEINYYMYDSYCYEKNYFICESKIG